MVEVSPVRSRRDHKAALADIRALIDKPKLSKREREKFDVLSALVAEYENRAYPSNDLDPIDLLKAHIDNSGRTQADFAKLVGRSMASLILSRRRAMSLDVIRKMLGDCRRAR